jgi:ParB family chromosome partitioning protein
MEIKTNKNKIKNKFTPSSILESDDSIKQVEEAVVNTSNKNKVIEIDGEKRKFKSKKITLNVYDVKPNPFQTRKDFYNIPELALSIKKHGVMQDPIVYLNANKEYVLIAGERRIRAIKLNCESYENYSEMTDFDLVEDMLSNEELEDYCIIENEQRQNNTLIEKADIIAKKIQKGMSTREIEELNIFGGTKKSTIAKLANISKLPEEVKKILNHKDINSTVKIELIGQLNKLEDQIVIATEIANNNPSVETITRMVDKLIREEQGNDKIKKDKIFTNYDRLKSPSKILSKSEYRKLPEHQRIEVDSLIDNISKLQDELLKYSSK